MRNGVDVGLDLLDQAAGFEALHDLLAGDETVEPVQFLNRLSQLLVGLDTLGEVRIVLQGQRGFRREYVHLRERVPLADLEIVEVVRRRDLDRA